MMEASSEEKKPSLAELGYKDTITVPDQIVYHTSKFVRVTQLQIELQFLRRNLNGKKDVFGMAVYQPYSENKTADVEKIFAAAKKEIQDVQAQVEIKEAELKSLQETGESLPTIVKPKLLKDAPPEDA
mmetsp:Transcript_68107/g.154075  ORF Transcript_68107/g.154075 Transcript_68107/m.154075 type:complete len:128 (+) Transcript_68107:168-551(+)